MPKPVVWIMIIATGITGYVLGTRVKAAEDTAKKVRKKVTRH